MAIPTITAATTTRRPRNNINNEMEPDRPRRTTTTSIRRPPPISRRGSSDSSSSSSSDYSSSSFLSASYHSHSHSGLINNGNNNNNFTHSYKKPDLPDKSCYLGMDCEMVGTLTGESVCARVVLVHWKGGIVFDAFVRPEATVTDYRTFVSGITADDLKTKGQPLADVRRRVRALIQDKILVGHGLENDLKCLGLEHPWHRIRDTAHYGPFMQKAQQQLDTGGYVNNMGRNSGAVMLPRKLKDLVAEKLGRTNFQVPGMPHCPAADAAAALDLYKTHRPRWEKCVQSDVQKTEQWEIKVQRRQYLEQQRIQLETKLYLREQQQRAFYQWQHNNQQPHRQGQQLLNGGSHHQQHQHQHQHQQKHQQQLYNNYASPAGVTADATTVCDVLRHLDL